MSIELRFRNSSLTSKCWTEVPNSKPLLFLQSQIAKLFKLVILLLFL